MALDGYALPFTFSEAPGDRLTASKGEASAHRNGGTGRQRGLVKGEGRPELRPLLGGECPAERKE